MEKKKQTTFDEIFIEYYQGIVLFGIVMVAMAVWLYEYHYTTTGDGLVGVLAACSLFFGTLLLGQGIRGWRDGEEFRDRYIKMRSRSGEELLIRKRKKRWFR
ncbi:MAG: hypothetical protein KKD17_04325 [Nanoarchaeota archaeon]|nr:hypothetical protein [Nanoarchaeota archaeon]